MAEGRNSIKPVIRLLGTSNDEERLQGLLTSSRFKSTYIVDRDVPAPLSHLSELINKRIRERNKNTSFLST